MPSKTLSEQKKKEEEKEAFQEMRREGKKSAATTVKERASRWQGKTVTHNQMDYLQWRLWSETHLNNHHTFKLLV